MIEDNTVHVDLAASAIAVERERANELRAVLRILNLYFAGNLPPTYLVIGDPLTFIRGALEADARYDVPDATEPGVCEMCGPAPVQTVPVLDEPPGCIWCGIPCR